MDRPAKIPRYLVKDVEEIMDLTDRGEMMVEKILTVQLDRTRTHQVIRLQGEWMDTPAITGSFVHVIGDFSPEGECVVDDLTNMIILHPDQLISSTVVADSFTCMRRAVLQDRVKATSEASPALVYGTMLHEIFQASLTHKQWDNEFLASTIQKTVEAHLEDLYTIRVDTAAAREHLLSKMPEFQGWAQSFIGEFPRPEALVIDRHDRKYAMCLSKLLDVEEHVWSPMYGLKGNIDATVQVTIQDGSQSDTFTVPFELKTGRTVSVNHAAQTALYNLLLSDRYDIQILHGILYYMETSKTMRIPTIRHELRQMILQRNRLAGHVRERSTRLPEMAQRKDLCNRCYAKPACFIYHKLADEGTEASSGVGSTFAELTRHLTPKHQRFFLLWDELLTKEEKETIKPKRELWTMTSAEREKVGRCFRDVVITELVEGEEGSRINRYQYTFRKRLSMSTENGGGGGGGSDFSFLESQIVLGDPIVVSDEQGHFALALGYVTAVSRQEITVAVDRRLHNQRIRQPGFDPVRNQVFAGIMEVVPEGLPADRAQPGQRKEAPVRYRIDKDEFSNGMALVRQNLVSIMSQEVPGATKIRSLVVEGRAPRFGNLPPSQYLLCHKDKDQNDDRDADADGGTRHEPLNSDQRQAIEKVLSAEDYALVLGMPGTGKTTTIAHIIRALVLQGKSVLLTSYTHTAVDNILLKLARDKIPILRVGATAKIHPTVQTFAYLSSELNGSLELIHKAWQETPVVATSCLGISHRVFAERTFDYCIVDEASQITLPVCLGPIRLAERFVLVGDHHQLPPLVQNEEARVGGLDVSLFKLLSDAHPESVVHLAHQYRMCEDIMTLSNTLIYGGRLCCGTEELRHRMLHVPHIDRVRQIHCGQRQGRGPGHAPGGSPSDGGDDGMLCSGEDCWLQYLLEGPQRVRFVNTDTLQPRAREEAKGSRIVNTAEAAVIGALVCALVTAGVAETEIGVMTHYRSQLSLLKHGLATFPGVEMHTADRFQGRDKEVVVLSLVRSNDMCHIGDLLKDWRRINVAFTRAKTKLLVVGSRDTLLHCGDEEMVSRFVALMEAKHWVYHLPARALGDHRGMPLALSVVAGSGEGSAVSDGDVKDGDGGDVKDGGGDGDGDGDGVSTPPYSQAGGKSQPYSSFPLSPTSIKLTKGRGRAEADVDSDGKTLREMDHSDGGGGGGPDRDRGHRPLGPPGGPTIETTTTEPSADASSDHVGLPGLAPGTRHPKKVVRGREQVLARQGTVTRDILNDMTDGAY